MFDPSLIINNISYKGYSMIGLYMTGYIMLFSIPVNIAVFFIIRHRKLKKSTSYDRYTTIIQTLTISYFVSFIAILLTFIILNSFGWYWDEALMTLIPLLFFTLLDVSLFLWYKLHTKSSHHEEELESLKVMSYF